ncbi:MAG: UDP-N-acetylglucosamine 1-carboxyvinyltransferase [Oscillospiraceae bacterium]|nr:UDP-N-acetylglucosamine 1-carboxyvinyltransferase [Oscillospiraceae bacterium]
MNIWHITGGERLEGALRVQGAKNAVLPIMAASVVTPAETELEDVPELRDVEATLHILRHLGCTAERTDGRVYIDSRGMCRCDVPHALMRELRSSVIFLGAILARCGEASLSLPGGCELGPRPVDLHLEALRTLGARVTERGGDIVCSAAALRGANIVLPFPSVGATENAMLCALAAEGETVIHNAAREPEIVDLQTYLRALGARIRGAGTSTVTVSGMRAQTYARHRILSDRIAAATLLCACAASGGDITLENTHPAHFLTVLDSLSEAGCDIITKSDAVRLRSTGRLIAPRPIVTRPYPGFPTDAQPPLMAACLKARGTTVFTENIFAGRYRHVEELRRLGADVTIAGRVAYISGVETLSGAVLTAGDLRGGAAMVIAALSAEGDSVIYDDGFIARGYDRLDAALRALGAAVRCEARI